MPTAIIPDDDWRDFAAAGAVDSTSDSRRWIGSPPRRSRLLGLITPRFGGGSLEERSRCRSSGRRKRMTGRRGTNLGLLEMGWRRDVKQVDVKDLIANLYGHDGKTSSPTLPETGLEFHANRKVGGLDLEIGGGGDDAVDEDDEWEFIAASEETVTAIA